MFPSWAGIPKPSHQMKGQKWPTFTPPATTLCRRYRGRVLLRRLQKYVTNTVTPSALNSTGQGDGKCLSAGDFSEAGHSPYIIGEGVIDNFTSGFFFDGASYQIASCHWVSDVSAYGSK